MELLQPIAKRLIDRNIRDFYNHTDRSVNVTTLVEHVAYLLDCQELVDDSESWLWDLASDCANEFEI